LFLGPEIDFFPPLKFIIMKGNGRQALAKEDKINLIAKGPKDLVAWGRGETRPGSKNNQSTLAWAMAKNKINH
jgi:hypothetical protein